MNDQITIITAFYDIKRESIVGAERDIAKYLEYFSFWAGLKNELIIYTDKEFKEDILNERKKHGLEHKTTIIIKEFESFEPQSLALIRNTFQNFDQTKARANPRNIECISAEYCFLMYMKVLCVCDSIQRGLGEENFMWLDFGFNHTDDFFTDKTQFNFTLINNEKMSKDKMNFFKLKDEEKDNLASIYFSMKTFIMGGLLFGNKTAWREFHKHFREALKCFASMGLMDDDQIFLLWCVRNYPQNYTLHRSYAWFDSLYEFMPKEKIKSLSIRSFETTIIFYKLAKKEIKKNLKDEKYLCLLKNMIKYFFYKFIYRKKLHIKFDYKDRGNYVEE
ncbi:protein YibB [Campylobacter sp. MIT 99-7217]|uniref:protein YibB n=1 Tax=Campylobacter sp. MIT 99-7217 TaxID=535091 RepID=UPI00115B7AAF|nr:protein YibB [Campylobacter sp. MIT 99-7217]TQR33751.1 protein YibB [Campylobacter sp. MIT 99-7217]